MKEEEIIKELKKSLEAIDKVTLLFANQIDYLNYKLEKKKPQITDEQIVEIMKLTLEKSDKFDYFDWNRSIFITESGYIKAVRKILEEK